ncbi:MAG TPA: sigma-70 family RNA polymerase sigma factor [Polyangiaceae bacterium]
MRKLAFPRERYERMSDAELVTAVAGGDTEAVGIVWDRHSRLVRSVLRANLGGDSALEDLVQEVFVVFLRSASSIRSGEGLRSFLATVAVRTVIGELRRRRVRRWVTLSPTGEVPDPPLPARDPESKEILDGLFRVLAGVSTPLRLAFQLRHIEGLEMLEVAEALGVSESTAKRNLAKARELIVARARSNEPALHQFLSQRGGDGNA